MISSCWFSVGVVCLAAALNLVNYHLRALGTLLHLKACPVVFIGQFLTHTIGIMFLHFTITKRVSI